MVEELRNAANAIGEISANMGLIVFGTVVVKGLFKKQDDIDSFSLILAVCLMIFLLSISVAVKTFL